MIRKPLFTAVVAATLGAAALLGAARAADQSVPAPRNPAYERMARHCADQDARLAAHLAYAEAKLKLTDAQKAEFTSLSAVLKDAAKPMAAMCGAKIDPARSTALPERLALMQKMADARAESLRKVTPAASAFYASLTLEQQKIADDLLPAMGGGMGRGGHGMGPGMGHGMGSGMGSGRNWN